MRDLFTRVDQNMIEISKKLAFYALITPCNQKEEKTAFFRALNKGNEYNPKFKYLDADLKSLMDELSALEDLTACNSAPMARIFLNKIRSLKNQIKLIQGDDKSFSSFSEELYGVPGIPGEKIALDILNQSKDENYVFPPEPISPDEMIRIFKDELGKAGINWKVCLSNSIVPKISISGKDRTVFLNSKLYYSLAEVERLKVHEVEVHVYRGANGESQPYEIFRDGLAGYDMTEEGLALYAEEKKGCLDADTRQMKLYAGRYYAVVKARNMSFYDTFVEMKKFFPDDLAYRITERVKRGLKDTSDKGAFAKDICYIDGKIKIEEYVANGGSISMLYLGKVGIDDVSMLLELLKAGELREPVFIPGIFCK